MKSCSVLLILAMGMSLIFAGTCGAAVILSAAQDGNDVTVNVNGSLDLTGLGTPTQISTLLVGFRPETPAFGRASGPLDKYAISASVFGSPTGSVIASGSGDEFFSIRPVCT